MSPIPNKVVSFQEDVMYMILTFGYDFKRVLPAEQGFQILAYLANSLPVDLEGYGNSGRIKKIGLPDDAEGLTTYSYRLIQGSALIQRRFELEVLGDDEEEDEK